MSTRVDPNLHRKVAGFGAFDIDACMNCGNCTATCPLSKTETPFPRKGVHLLQLGLKDKLIGSLDPWLCYYCGECSETCPRDANPGEAMMASRRYLTSQYDWTGLAGKFYVSKAWEFTAIAAVAFFVAMLFYFFHGPMITDRVELNTFAPVKWVEIGDLVMAGLLSFFLLTNALRMFYFTMLKGENLKIPLSLYIKTIPSFITHFITQKKWRTCEGKNTRWLKHLLLVSGYLTMLTLIVVFLRWFQTDTVHPLWHPQRWLGYYATAVLLYVTVDFMIGRYRKSEQISKFSEPSDWAFLVLLFLTALTGIMLHGFRLAGLPMLTYYIYVIHLAIAVPMLVVEVPFGKWAHLFYRPFAIYLEDIKEKSKTLAAQKK